MQKLLKRVRQRWWNSDWLPAFRLSGPSRVFIAGKVKSIATKNGNLTIKTTSSRQADLIAAIRHLHSYTEPEIIILPIIGASEGYASWLAEQTTPI